MAAASLGALAIIATVVVLVQHISLRPPTTSTASPHEPLPLPDKPSIVVLPFANLSGDPGQDYFSDGMTDGLIAQLSRTPSLFVIARSSSFTYKSKPVNVRDIGRQLGVKYVLEGSVLKAANQVRITAQLADTHNGAELWAQSYDRSLRDVFSTQDEIVHKILTTLQLQLALSQSGIPMFSFPHGTNNIEAYDYFLRSIEPYFTFTREGVNKSCEMDERALALDPKYVDAMWGLGFCYVTGVILGYSQNPARDVQIASDFAKKALALDDASPEAYYLMSQINWVQGRDAGHVDAARRHYVQAVDYAKRGIALEPSNPFGYQRLADALIPLGQPAEAVEATNKAMRLDPIGSELYLYELGWGYTAMGRFNDAIPVLTRALIRQPENLGLHLLLTLCYSETDQKERAMAEAAEVLQINPNFSLKMLHAGPGDRNFSHALADWREAGLN